VEALDRHDDTATAAPADCLDDHDQDVRIAAVEAPAGRNDPLRAPPDELPRCLQRQSAASCRRWRAESRLKTSWLWPLRPSASVGSQHKRSLTRQKNSQVATTGGSHQPSGLQSESHGARPCLSSPVVLGQGTRLFPDAGPDTALDLVGSRTDSKSVTIQVYRPAGRPQYAVG
jgi:hypothetical protein